METLKPWLVAVLANTQDDVAIPSGAPADAQADFDHIETIQAIQAAIESAGHRTVFLQADSHLPDALKQIQPDICFNLAEGLGGDGREAQVPGLLEMLHIPYTGSRVVAHAISLDKTLTKRIWRDNNLPIAPFQQFDGGDQPLHPDLRFPLFVKPAREGTGMGLDAGAIVHNQAQLQERIKWVVATYRQPALVEQYLPGREFTVAVMGRPDAKHHSRHPEWYSDDGFHRFPILEMDSSHAITPGLYSNAAKAKNVGEPGAPTFYCPAQIDDELAQTLQDYALRAHNALGALDISRTDMRLNANGQPCLIEINTLPGLTPDFSDLCLIANADGMAYKDLILEILYLGASRWGMLNARGKIINI